MPFELLTLPAHAMTRAQTAGIAELTEDSEVWKSRWTWRAVTGRM